MVKPLVLIVEDQLYLAALLSKQLEFFGFASHRAANGLDAVVMANETAYDLILMDVNMPVLDGLEATRRIRSNGSLCKHAPVVAITGQSNSDTCIAAGMNDFVQKPIKLRDIRSLIDRWIGTT